MATKPEQLKCDFLDVLHRLQHDLGKYLTLSIRFLPMDSSDLEFQQAVEDGLLRTLQTHGQMMDARSIWERYQVEITRFPEFRKRCDPEIQEMHQAIERVLSWAGKAAQIHLNRAQVRKDLMAVPEKIRLLIERIRHE